VGPHVMMSVGELGSSSVAGCLQSLTTNARSTGLVDCKLEKLLITIRRCISLYRRCFVPGFVMVLNLYIVAESVLESIIVMVLLCHPNDMQCG
jgi:hypothetical protein